MPCNFGKSLGRSRLALTFVLVLTSTFSMGGALGQEVVRVGGTGLGTLLMQRIAESYLKGRPDAQVKVLMPPLGSNGGLRALDANTIQLAIVTFPAIFPAKSEADSTRKAVLWLTTPLVFTGRDIKTGEGFTLDQVADIYASRTTHWKDGTPVRLIARTDRESDTRILRSLSPQLEAAVAQSLSRTGIPFAENDFDAQQMLEKTPGSFGTVGLGQLLLSESSLRPAAINRVVPTTDALRGKAYPIEKPLYLVTSASPSAATVDLMTYLGSPEVMNIARRLGFAPLQH